MIPDNSEDAADTAADNGEGSSEKLSDCPGFQFTKLGTAHEEDLVNTGHSTAYVIGGGELANGIADDGADRISTSHDD